MRKYLKLLVGIASLCSLAVFAEPKGPLTLPSQLSAGYAYIDAGMYKEAVQSLRKFDPKTDGQISDLNIAFGKIYLGIDQPQKALKYFDFALEYNPASYQALILSADAYIKLGDIKEAKRVLQKAAPKDRGQFDVAYYEALCDEVTGNSAAATKRLQDLLDKNPKSDKLIVSIAKLHMQRGQPQEAMNFLSQKQVLVPSSGAIQDAIGDTLLALGQKDLAIQEKQQAAKLYAAAGDYEKSQSALLVANKLSGKKMMSAPNIAPPPDAPAIIEPVPEDKITKREIKPEITPKISIKPPVEEGHHPKYADSIIDKKQQSAVPEYETPPVPSNFNRFPFPSGTPISGGSGIVIDGGKKVITNRHVIEGGKDFAVRNGLGEMSRAKVIYKSQADDIAILELDSPLPKEHAISSSQFQGAKAGGDVVVMGYPLWHVLGSSTPSITNGVVAKATGISEDPSSFQLTAKINKGNSGGPVFDHFGNLLGITVGKLNSDEIKRGNGVAPEDVNFAIHIARINSALKIPESKSIATSESKKFMNSEEIYQMMIGKVVMVAVALE
jgi:S1-C subfamily serine protease/Tfp pilus assembly protein PilF